MEDVTDDDFAIDEFCVIAPSSNNWIQSTTTNAPKPQISVIGAPASGTVLAYHYQARNKQASSQNMDRLCHVFPYGKKYIKPQRSERLASNSDNTQQKKPETQRVEKVKGCFS